MFLCLLVEWTGSVWEGWVLLQLMCLLEMPPHLCWEDLVQGSRGALGVWADRSRWGLFPPTLTKGSCGAMR